MQGSATIKDISKALNISVSTVSRALRDTYDVRKSTRDLVLAKARELQYRPNFNAIGLASGKTHNIGVILPFITNYYFSTVITGIQEAAYENDYNVILFLTNNSAGTEMSIAQGISMTGLDGLLISLTSNKGVVHRHYQKIMTEYNKPIVFFDRATNKIETSKVLQDDYQGAIQAVEHLIKSGYSKIAHITGPMDLDLTRRRLKGYLHALKKHKLPIRKEWVISSGFSEDSGKKDTNKLLQSENPPDAIFAVNDRKAIGTIIALKSRNISIGKEVGVIGFTNDPVSSIISPSLTTISEPAFDIGKKSVEILFKHLSKKRFPFQKVVLPCKLIKRESTTRS